MMTDMTWLRSITVLAPALWFIVVTAAPTCNQTPVKVSTQSACKTAAVALNLNLGGGGYSFGSTHYSNKGCYYYKTGRYGGMAFWGGSSSDVKMYGNDFTGDQHRLRLPGCVKHILTEKLCKETVDILNKKGYSLKKGGAGYKFSGTYGTKGCYAYHSGKYSGRVYWSNGGSQKQMEEAVDGDKYRLPLYTNDPTPFSPYSNLDPNNVWLVGNFHNHVEQYKSSSLTKAAPGAGGSVGNAEMLQMMYDHGHHFTVATGHEVMPGQMTNKSGESRFARPFLQKDLPHKDFIVVNSYENQANSLQPNWMFRSDQCFRKKSTGHLHRIYMSGKSQAYWIVHPNYDSRDKKVSRGEAVGNLGTCEQIRGVEIYNTYGEDRMTQDINDVGNQNSNPDKNPYGSSLWDDLLSNGPNYPIYGITGDDGFLNRYGPPDNFLTGDDYRKIPAPAAHRFGTARVVVSLPSDYTTWNYEDKQKGLTDAIDQGRFYSTQGNIELTNIKFANGVLSAKAVGFPVEWHLIGINGRTLSLTSANGKCQRSLPESNNKVCLASSVEIKIDPEERFTRVEAWRTKNAKVEKVWPETAVWQNGKHSYSAYSRAIVLGGIYNNNHDDIENFLAMANTGDLLHIVSKSTKPGVIIRSERYVHDPFKVIVWVLDEEKKSQDSRFKTNRMVDSIQCNDEVKIVQRAWLQPTWGNGVLQQ